jgi:hypothetical protein
VKIEFQYEEILFLLWMFLLLPWVILAGLVGMAFDAGSTLRAYIVVSSVWTYPVSVWMVWRFRERSPVIALLPFLNIAALLSDVLWKSN